MDTYIPVNKEFDRVAKRAKEWLDGMALPMWSEVGVDFKQGGFFERLDRDGHPIDIGYRRTRLTGRQIYVFCHAYLLGHKTYGSIIEHGIDFLLRKQKGDRLGEWYRSVSSSGEVLDDTIDLYDYAFVLFGLAWWYRISSDNLAKKLALETLQAIKNKLQHPSGMGYLHEINAGEPYQQNPHMHLMEALIEWFEVTWDQIFYDELDHLLQLFTEKFYVEGTVREYFDSQWSPINGEAGLIIEPGHMAEWAWILKRYATLKNDKPILAVSELMEFVKNSQGNHKLGLIYDIVDPKQNVTKSSSRLWPQTEYVKGIAANFYEDRDLNSILIINHIDKIFDQYVIPGPKGGWLEHLDVEGQSIVDFIPASSLYHISLAFNEVDKISRNNANLENDNQLN